MKLIQLNAWSGALSAQICKFLALQQPDILHLQEVVSSPDGKSSYFDLLQDVEKCTGLPHVFLSATSDFMFGRKRITYGNAILSRDAMTSRHQEFTHLAFKTDFDHAVDDYNARVFQHAVIHVGDKPLHLLNYHGLHVREHKNGNDATAAHCARIAAYMAQLDGPKILSGDFNLAPDSPSLAPLNAALRNLVTEHDIATTRNQFARSMTPVDFIWVSDDVTVTDFHVAPDLISDHAALVLEFTL